MKLPQFCAYNQTRDCFLSLDVVAGDFSFARLDDWMRTLTLEFGAGLWLTPFRGIPATSVPFPLDLIYLDQDRRVIDIVEVFPTFHVSSSRPPAASVLALRAHSIYASQTQLGDQLVLCTAEEMTRHLERFSSEFDVAGAVPRACQVLYRQEPHWSAGSGPLQAVDSTTEQRPECRETSENILIEHEMKDIRPSRGWLERWLFPDPSDPRRSLRQPATGLTAQFWTGGPTKANSIRDISATGLYVVNEERWYLGTMVRMTLAKTDSEERPAERSITVQTVATRWGNDGVGLQFVRQNAKKLRQSQPSPLDCAGGKDLDQFLKQFRGGNR
jgi:Uncharacterized ACR, COG1430